MPGRRRTVFGQNDRAWVGPRRAGMKSARPLRALRNRRLLGYCLEGLWELALCKILILFFPFRDWSTRGGRFQSETLRVNMEAGKPLFRNVSRAVREVARVVPWHSKCLDQALAAQRMLARRGLASTIY